MFWFSTKKKWTVIFFFQLFASRQTVFLKKMKLMVDFFRFCSFFLTEPTFFFLFVFKKANRLFSKILFLDRFTFFSKKKKKSTDNFFLLLCKNRSFCYILVWIIKFFHFYQHKFSFLQMPTLKKKHKKTFGFL